MHSFYSSSSPSGENTAVRLQEEALIRSGLEVSLVKVETDTESANVAYPLFAAARVMTGRGKSPLEEVLSTSPDVVHIHNMFPNWGNRWLHHVKAPKVASLHNYRPICAAGTLYRGGSQCTLCPTKGSFHSLKHRCYRDSAISTVPLTITTAKPFAEQFLPQHVDRVIFLSNEQKATYDSFRGGAVESSVLPNFVPDLEVAPEIVRPTSGWCYIGRISEEKGIRDLVSSWPKNHRLDIYGEGPEVDWVRANLNQGITFHGGIDNSQVPGVLAEHQGLIFPSRVSEISPLVYIEALRSARPVIAYSANAVGKDIIENGLAGGSVYADLTDLVTCIEHLEDSVPARREARKIYLKKYSEPVWIAGATKIYQDVCKN